MGTRGEASDLAEIVHTHLEDEHLRVGGGGQDGQRQADKVVVVARGGVNAEALCQTGGQYVLGGGLADGARHTDHGAVQACAVALGEAQEELGGVVAGQQRAIARVGGVDESLVGLPRHHDGGGALLNSGGGEIVSIDALAGERDEDGVRPDFAGVDDDAAAYAIGITRDAARARGALEVLDCDLNHIKW